MSEQDPVRAYLAARGCAPSVIESGLTGLVENWESVVGAVETGYALGLDDYLNDLDVRQLLEEVWGLAFVAERELWGQRLQRADEQMKALVRPGKTCLWGAEVAEEEGWTAIDNWWYFSRPLQGAPAFLAELAEADGED